MTKSQPILDVITVNGKNCWTLDKKVVEVIMQKKNKKYSRNCDLREKGVDVCVQQLLSPRLN